jgi:hypothetical protein
MSHETGRAGLSEPADGAGTKKVRRAEDSVALPEDQGKWFVLVAVAGFGGVVSC